MGGAPGRRKTLGHGAVWGGWRLGVGALPEEESGQAELLPDFV